MSSSALLERSTPAVYAMGGPSVGYQPTGHPSATPTGANWCYVPRCTVKFEKCKDGCKIHCKCDDDVACGTLQNLCRMLCEGLCNCVCQVNGVAVCHCSFPMGACKVDYTKDGCCITCTSGDKAACAMIQACCECLEACCKSGCCCYVCFGGAPVCCATC